MKVSIGIESTFAPQSGSDTLSLTGHYRKPIRDLELVGELGINEFRYPIPWHRIEQQRGSYDWKFLDHIIPFIYEEMKLSIIADPLHHTSYPAWLRKGFLDPDFVPAYKRFVLAFARRYPMVTSYALFNEPTCTLDFCGYRGFWHPYGKSDWLYVWMLQETARAYGEVALKLRQKNRSIRLVHVDTFEHHAALDKQSVRPADFLNERRFLFEELLLGRITPRHPLYQFLLKHGFSEEGLAWHQEHPIQIDERGGNYYPLSEEQLLEGKTFHAPSWSPRGFAEVVTDYAARLDLPLSLTETNIQGSVADRISWLKYMLEQTEKLDQRGISLQQFAWYPLFDCAGWHCLLQGENWQRDPQGIYVCTPRWKRLETELSRSYRKVVGGMRSQDLPAYRFQKKHDQTLRGLLPQMKWHWSEAPEELSTAA